MFIDITALAIYGTASLLAYAIHARSRNKATEQERKRIDFDSLDKLTAHKQKLDALYQLQTESEIHSDRPYSVSCTTIAGRTITAEIIQGVPDAIKIQIEQEEQAINSLLDKLTAERMGHSKQNGKQTSKQNK